MTHTSPATSALWAILSTILFCYLVTHLWKFDRFACVKWNRGNSGAFKRVMTYSYLTSVPLLMLYSITTTVIKYEEGYVDLPSVGIVATPYQLWPERRVILVEVIYVAFSVAWALEIVSHLEELCFWLFLINVGAAQTSWFRSIHFKSWVVGSLLAVTGLPITAVLTRKDPVKCEAWTFFIGSIGSLLITLWSLRVLWLFPAFLRRVKNEGAEPEVVVRLSTFHELNIIRIVFRFMFVVPLLILASDGIKPNHNHVNESPLLVDLFSGVAAVGCVVSSIITLLIFFPRSIAKEAGYKPRQKTMSQNSRGVHVGPRNTQHQAQQIASSPVDIKDPNLYDEPQQPEYGYRAPTIRIGGASQRAAATGGGVWERVGPESTGTGGAWEMVDYHQYQQHGVLLPTVMPRRGSRRETALHPMVLNYTSPIDLVEGWDESDPLPTAQPTHY